MGAETWPPGEPAAAEGAEGIRMRRRQPAFGRDFNDDLDLRGLFVTMRTLRWRFCTTAARICLMQHER